jgi:solute carrier family 6 amino acid transporter-like protein 5/7/9/14
VCSILSLLVKVFKHQKIAVYILVPLPYVLLTILFIKGITLPGHTLGWKFLFTPNWSKLFTFKIWIDAVAQSLYSAGLAQTTIIYFASHKVENEGLLKPSICIPILNFLTSLFAAFTLFSFIGYASSETGVAIQDMPVEGMELTFVVYPAMLQLLPFPQFWGAIFFLMLTLIGLASEYIFIEVGSSLIHGLLKRMK